MIHRTNRVDISDFSDAASQLREMIDTDKKYVDKVSLIKFLLMKDVRPVHKRLQNLYEKPFSSVKTLFSTST